MVTSTYGALPVTTSEQYELSPQVAPPGFELTTRGRVTHWTGDADDFELAYDGKSNLLFRGSTSFTYNAEGNRLLSIDLENGPPIFYAYDEAGFATSRDGLPITWMANGRMTSHGADTLAWDVLGRPISSTVDGTTTRSIFGGTVVAGAQDVPLRIDLETVSIDLQGSAHLYRHFDARGNVKFTTADAGVAVSHYGYTPYGLDVVYDTLLGAA